MTEAFDDDAVSVNLQSDPLTAIQLDFAESLRRLVAIFDEQCHSAASGRSGSSLTWGGVSLIAMEDVSPSGRPARALSRTRSRPVENVISKSKLARLGIKNASDPPSHALRLAWTAEPLSVGDRTLEFLSSARARERRGSDRLQRGGGHGCGRDRRRRTTCHSARDIYEAVTRHTARLVRG
jgi:hypothetical protein